MVIWLGRIMEATFQRKLLLGVCALGVAVSGWAEEPRYFAIRNAHIVPGSGPEIKSGTVVIAKRLIATVDANVRIPPGANFSRRKRSPTARRIGRPVHPG